MQQADESAKRTGQPLRRSYEKSQESAAGHAVARMSDLRRPVDLFKVKCWSVDSFVLPQPLPMAVDAGQPPGADSNLSSQPDHARAELGDELLESARQIADNLSPESSSRKGDEEPIELIGQVIDTGGRRLFWLDALDRQCPRLVALGKCVNVRYLGSFEQFSRDHVGRVAMVLGCAYHLGVEPSPSLIVRAVEVMRWQGASAEQALRHVLEAGGALLRGAVVASTVSQPC